MKKQEEIEALFKEVESLNIPDLSESLENILRAHTTIIQSIYDSKPALDVGEVYIETLTIKLLLASKSALELSRGSNISGIDTNKKVQILDISSIYILTRAVLENFLTLEYLFFNKLSREEQIFRYNLWRISGFMSRQNYDENLQPHLIEKLEREKEEIEILKETVKKSPFYPSLNKHHIWKLNSYGLPRILSWDDLIKQSCLKSNLFGKLYKLYSNYAHSEFISAIQLNENSQHKTNKFNEEVTITSLSNLRMINCVSISLIKDKFQCTKESYNGLGEELKYSIDFWKKFSTE
ncbi:hypothetical protein [Salinimicrobium sp. WS361]|uniref:hypothetical protein n=1 Tax=Salinimicrobium sp. WS361 TaxID=3425123 RepID=UPI003D6F063C